MTDGDRLEVIAELEPRGRTAEEMARDLGGDLTGSAGLDVLISTVHETAYLARWDRGGDS